MPLPTSEDLGDFDNDSTVPNDQYGIGEEPKVSEAECPVELNQSDDQLSEQTTTNVMMITSSSDLTPSTSDTITESLEIESSFVKTTVCLFI